jgi:hypothetical protein
MFPLVLFSYLLLFVNFYLCSYIVQKTRGTKPKKA